MLSGVAMTHPPATLTLVNAPEQWAAARRLVEEYARSLDIDLSFQAFATELADLPAQYAPPHGLVVLASTELGYVGCGAYRRLDDGVCEMKRLYVAPAAQGRGVGHAIAARLVAEAARADYHTMRLDTLPTMAKARSLYASMGFRQTAAYRFNPVPGATFWELTLRDAASSTHRVPGDPTADPTGAQQ